MCGKFGDCTFSRFGFIARTNTDAALCLTPATIVNNNTLYWSMKPEAGLIQYNTDKRQKI